MKHLAKRGLSLLLALLMCVSLLSGLTFTVNAQTVNYVTGSSDDYKNVILNWGQRGTTATYLSPNAEAFYAENDITYAELSALSGSADTASVPSSELYLALQKLMKDNHSVITTYQKTRYVYRFTDCENGTDNSISSFYSGAAIGPEWDSGKTWNREHTWPNSKGDASGDGENDIMMLRPTATKENGSRGNKAYGESTGYYDPNVPSNGAYNLHGDVARIMLYVYVRWGNTGKMWGSSGVIESKELLLEWMEEDPVDTWELGRNDSVESITGTRNVFVDYPELAFLLFDENIPEDMVTPSGEAAAQPCQHSNTTEMPAQDPTCTASGCTAGIYCNDCSTYISGNEPIAALGHSYTNYVSNNDAACTTDGTKTAKCDRCDNTNTETDIGSATGHSYGQWVTEGEKEVRTCSACQSTEERDIQKEELIENPFVDVKESDFFYAPVLWAVEKGVTEGYGSDTIFNPDGICTRGQVVTFLWRTAGEPAPSSSVNPFVDVTESDYYYTAVLWAVEEGITNGYGSETIFNPNGNCTRGQVATFLHRYFHEPIPASKNNPFTDVTSDAFYYTAVLWAVGEDITNGYGNDYTFAPNMECTRGQIVTFLYRAMNPNVHVHHYTAVETVAPTTETEGYDLHTCSECGASYKDNYTDKLPADDGSSDDEGGYYWFGNQKRYWNCASQGHHSMADPVVIQNPTCIHDKIVEYTCDVVGCGATWTENKGGAGSKHAMSAADQANITKGDYFYSIRCRCGKGNRGSTRDEALAAYYAHMEDPFAEHCTNPTIVEEWEGHYHNFPSSTFNCTVCGESVAFSEVYAYCDEC